MEKISFFMATYILGAFQQEHDAIAWNNPIS